MNNETQIKHINAFTDKMKAIITSKKQDYAQESDVLSNFKQVASMCGISPEKVILVFCATKVARLGVLLSSGKAPNNESIEDTLVDLANYSALLGMVRADTSTDGELVFAEDKVVPINKSDSFCDTYCRRNNGCDRKTCAVFPSTSE